MFMMMTMMMMITTMTSYVAPVSAEQGAQGALFHYQRWLSAHFLSVMFAPWSIRRQQLVLAAANSAPILYTLCAVRISVVETMTSCTFSPVCVIFYFC